MLNWSKQFSILLLLDSCEYTSKYGRYECLLAVHPIDVIAGNMGDLLNRVSIWHQERKDWLFGHICYDYKNNIEPKLSSRHLHRFDFPLLHFFCPAIVCYINEQRDALTIESIGIEPSEVWEAIAQYPLSEDSALPILSFLQSTSQQQYLEIIQTLRQHIADGDCYEINFCNQGYCEGVALDPMQVFRKLKDISPAPFSAYYKLNHSYMICASPERYLYKEGPKILSQPIKGTARRDANPEKDLLIKEELQNSIKNKAENVMIVDLVRNDLARSCETGSVTVEELFGIYSFPQVHQMISTVSGNLKKQVSFTDALRYSFPMGSMTGAPKIKVMQLIEQYERSGRELFSGTAGYITPHGDFDFNVIIRSLFYDETLQYLSYQTGGAITYDSDPMEEWEEMRLKAWALERIFT